MKKIFLTMALAIAGLTANAQVFVGGEVGFWRNWDGNHTEVSVRPEVGYVLSDKWAIGTGLDVVYNYYNGLKSTAVGVSPYARYTFTKFGPVSLFLDGGVAYYHIKNKYKTALGDVEGDGNAFEVGIKPGLAVNITPKLSFVSHIGFLGYRDTDNDEVSSQYFSPIGENGFGFDLSGKTLTFGLYYNF